MSAEDYRESLEGMVWQFAYRGQTKAGAPTLWTGGLSALELAFETLGWPDPKPFPEYQCGTSGCDEFAFNTERCPWRPGITKSVCMTCYWDMQLKHSDAA